MNSRFISIVTSCVTSKKDAIRVIDPYNVKIIHIDSPTSYEIKIIKQIKI